MKGYKLYFRTDRLRDQGVYCSSVEEAIAICTAAHNLKEGQIESVTDGHTFEHGKALFSVEAYNQLVAIPVPPVAKPIVYIRRD